MTKSDQDKYDLLRSKLNLTHKQALFCIQYKGNASESARLAGYGSPDQTGYKLVRNSQIKEGIKLVRSHDPVSILSPEQILKAWSSIATDPTASPQDRMKSLENLARSHAMFTEKSISLNYTKSDRLDQMTDLELNKLLEQTIRSLVKSDMIPIEILDSPSEDHSS